MRRATTYLIAACLLGLTRSATAAAAVSNELAVIRAQWAQINYQLPADQRASALEALDQRAHRLSERDKGAAPLIWEAIVKASLAREKGAFGGALGYVKEAKGLLERAEAMDPTALDGSVYTSLGSLYYKVPGWPLSFGDDDKAREYLQKALRVNPDGIDPNYFYGDFLLEQGDYQGAVQALEKALAAPARKGREVADQGRREEIRQALAKAKEKLGS